MPKKPLFSPLFGDSVFALIARLFISAIFVQGALGKILGWSGQATYMQSHHLPGQLIPTMLGIALVIEAAGVLCLNGGWQARAAAFVMCVYLGVVSVLLHNFWAAQGMAAGGQLTRMKERGLIERRKADKRVVLVVLTKHGREKLKAARPIHAGSVRRNLLARLNEEQVATIVRVSNILGEDD